MQRHFYVAVAAMALATAPLVKAESAADRACTREAMPRTVAAVRPEVAALFVHADQMGDIVETEEGTLAPMGPLEVVMVRKGKDGKLTFACVNGAESAQRFLDGTSDRPARAKEK